MEMKVGGHFIEHLQGYRKQDFRFTLNTLV